MCEITLGIAPSLRPGPWPVTCQDRLASTGAGRPGKSSEKPADPSWCPMHKVKMKRGEKDGQVWYLHKTKDGWCRGQAQHRGSPK